MYEAIECAGRGMGRAQPQVRSRPDASLTRRRPGKGRRASKRFSLIRRIGRAIWLSPLHIGLALTTGLGCGAVAARHETLISAPVAAILGTVVAYPALVAIWSRLPRVARH